MNSNPTDKGTSRRERWIGWAICAGALLYVFPYYPQINNPNENVRLYMTAAIIEHGTYEISALRKRWGWVNDAAAYEGRLYSVKAPGTSFLGVPAYLAYHVVTQLAGLPTDRAVALWVCRVSATIAPTLVFLWFLFGWLDRRTSHPTTRTAVFLSLALGSLLYAYGLLFVSHTTSAAAAFGSFMILYERRRSPPCSSVSAFIAGLLAAAVTFLEYPGLAISVGLCLYAWFAVRPRRGLLWFGAGALLPTLAVMHFQWCAFGSPFSPGHLYVENSLFRAAHHEGFYGATHFHPEAAWSLLADPGFGLFPLTPLLLFAFVGFPILLRRHDTRVDGAIALGCTVLTWLLISTMNNWRGGWTLGPRYLAPVVPFLGWASLVGIDACRRFGRGVAGVALGATAAGLIASGVASAYYPHVPPDITRPLPQLFAVLIDHGFAPSNAATLLLDWGGTGSMIPFFLLGLAAVVWLSQQGPLEIGARVRTGLIGTGTAALLLVPSLSEQDRADESVRRAVAFVTRHWNPPGHDRAARLAATPSTEMRAHDWQRLADLYEEQGRDAEAHRFRSRARAVP